MKTVHNQSTKTSISDLRAENNYFGTKMQLNVDRWCFFQFFEYISVICKS